MLPFENAPQSVHIFFFILWLFVQIGRTIFWKKVNEHTEDDKGGERGTSNLSLGVNTSRIFPRLRGSP